MIDERVRTMLSIQILSTRISISVDLVDKILVYFHEQKTNQLRLDTQHKH